MHPGKTLCLLFAAVVSLHFGRAAFCADENPYFRAQLIFKPTLRYPRCHASYITAMPDGSLISAWWNGSEEAGRDLVIRTARRPAGQSLWGPPRILVDNPGVPEGVPVLFPFPGSELWLIYRTGLPFNRLKWMKSTDSGRTWGDSDLMIEEPGWCSRSRIIELANGDILLPILGLRGEKHNCSAFLYSTNRGRNWKRTKEIKTEPRNNEPTVIQRSDGSLLTFMRPHDRDPAERFILQSESFDNGRTWSKAKRTRIKNPSSAVELLKLRNGHVVLAFNNSREGRSPLCLALSLDDGNTWGYMRVLEDSPGRFSYPSVTQGLDDRIHLSYTFRRTHIKHAEVNEAWIMDKPWINFPD